MMFALMNIIASICYTAARSLQKCGGYLICCLFSSPYSYKYIAMYMVRDITHSSQHPYDIAIHLIKDEQLFVISIASLSLPNR